MNNINEAPSMYSTILKPLGFRKRNENEHFHPLLGHVMLNKQGGWKHYPVKATSSSTAFEGTTEAGLATHLHTHAKGLDESTKNTTSGHIDPSTSADVNIMKESSHEGATYEEPAGNAEIGHVRFLTHLVKKKGYKIGGHDDEVGSRSTYVQSPEGHHMKVTTKVVRNGVVRHIVVQEDASLVDIEEQEKYNSSKPLGSQLAVHLGTGSEGRYHVGGHPVDHTGGSDEEGHDFCGVDKAAASGAIKHLRKNGFPVKRHDDHEFTVGGTFVKEDVTGTASAPHMSVPGESGGKKPPKDKLARRKPQMESYKVGDRVTILSEEGTRIGRIVRIVEDDGSYIVDPNYVLNRGVKLDHINLGESEIEPYVDAKSILESLKNDFITEASDVQFNTDAYRGAHGKHPRGNGTWYISHKRSLDFSKDKAGVDYIHHNGTLVSAKAAATQHAKENGHTVMHILP